MSHQAVRATQPASEPVELRDTDRVKSLLGHEVVRRWADNLAMTAREHRIHQSGRTRGVQRVAILVTEELLKAADDDLGLRLVRHIGDLEWEVCHQARQQGLLCDQLPGEVPLRGKERDWASLDPLKLHHPAREPGETISPLCRIAFMVLMANGGEVLPDGFKPSIDLRKVEIFPAIWREVKGDEVRRRNTDGCRLLPGLVGIGCDVGAD